MDRAWMIQSISRQILTALMCCMALLLGQALAANAEDGTLATSTSGMKISGFVDVSYTHNFNNPSDRENPGRIFDTKDDDFTLHQTQLFFERAAVAGSDPLGRAGFGLRLVYGRDAEVMDPSAGDTKDQFAFEEAYLTYAVNDKLQAKVGKYVTLLGAEVIDNTGNFNISRSFLFGHAIP
ncbi:MAG: outer membrane beta-barrel protein, partial [Nitrospirales bacterium]